LDILCRITRGAAGGCRNQSAGDEINSENDPNGIFLEARGSGGRFMLLMALRIPALSKFLTAALLILSLTTPIARAEECRDLFAAAPEQAGSVSRWSAEEAALLADLDEYLRLRGTYDYPRERFQYPGDWLESIQSRLSVASPQLIKFARERFRNLLPNEEMLRKTDNNQVHWAFALRDIGLMKRRMEFLIEDQTIHGISKAVISHTRDARNMPESDLDFVFGELTKNYQTLSKVSPPRSEWRIAPRRSADAAIAVIAGSALNRKDLSGIERYQAYLNKVKQLTGDQVRHRSSQDAAALLRLFGELQKILKRNPSGPDQIVIFGSSVNGRAGPESDLDFGIYKTDESKEWRGVEPSDYDQVSSAVRRHFGDKFSISLEVFEFPTPQEMIQFGLRLNAAVIVISRSKIELVSRDQTLELAESL